MSLAEITMVSNTIGGLKDGKMGGFEQNGIRDDLEEPKSWVLAVEGEKAGWVPLVSTFLF